MQIQEKYKSFFNNFTEFIFVPGNGYPQMAEHAAELWKQGYAPWIVPSGRYSIVTGKFAGVLAHQEKYVEEYETEWDFLNDVLVKNGVDESAVLKENQATYTYQNAIFTRKILDERGIHVHKAIICCKAQHARRCKMYYELLFPEAQILVSPTDVGVNRENWFLSEEGIEEVLGEVERCGKQFHKIMRELT